MVPEFEEWNYVDMEKLAKLRKGIVSDERDLKKPMNESFYPIIAIC